MKKTQVIKKDEYDWMLVSYGEDQFEKDKKKCREEGRVEGRVETSESIALKLLEDNYPLEKISKVTGLDIPRILQLAKYNNLE